MPIFNIILHSSEQLAQCLSSKGFPTHAHTLITLLSSLVLVGCGEGSDSSSRTANPEVPVEILTPTPSPTGDFSDPEIASIMTAANQAIIEAAEQAEEKADAAEVQEFALLLLTKHATLNEKVGTLVTRLSITPEPNLMRQKILDDGEIARLSWRRAVGAEFDRAYITSTIASHQQLLTLLEQRLIPSVEGAELKQLLVETQTEMQAHLSHAATLQQ